MRRIFAGLAGILALAGFAVVSGAARGERSPVGRTRTAPVPGSGDERLRIALASCQQYEQGYFGAHRHLAADDPDLVAFVGQGQRQAGIDSTAVDQNSAGAALAVIATFFRSGQVEMFPQRVEQGGSRIGIKREIVAVNPQLHLNKIAARRGGCRMYRFLLRDNWLAEKIRTDGDGGTDGPEPEQLRDRRARGVDRVGHPPVQCPQVGVEATDVVEMLERQRVAGGLDRIGWTFRFPGRLLTAVCCLHGDFAGRYPHRL